MDSTVQDVGVSFNPAMAGTDTASAKVHSVVDVPFNALLELRSSGEPGRLLKMSQRHCLSNHIGTLHAAALMALAEAASAEFLLHHFGLPDGMVPLLRRFEAKFCGAARGEISSTASAVAEKLEQFERRLAAKGRGLVNVEVDLYDQEERKVLTAKACWYVSRLAAS